MTDQGAPDRLCWLIL